MVIRKFALLLIKSLSVTEAPRKVTRGIERHRESILLRESGPISRRPRQTATFAPFWAKSREKLPQYRAVPGGLVVWVVPGGPWWSLVVPLFSWNSRFGDHLEQNGLRSLVAIHRGPEVEPALAGGRHGGGGDEKLPFVLAFDDQQAVQADVVHINAVGKIAAGIGIPERDPAVESIATGFDASGPFPLGPRPVPPRGGLPRRRQQSSP